MVDESCPTSPQPTPNNSGGMATASLYAGQQHSLDLNDLCSDVNAALVAGDWYNTNTFGFSEEQYDSTFTSPVAENQPWTSFARASGPDMSLSGYMQQNPNDGQPMLIPQPLRDNNRPRSSPGSFGNAMDIQWPTSGGMGMFSPQQVGTPDPGNSTSYPPSLFQTYPSTDDPFSMSSMASTPEIRRPRLQCSASSSYANIAPHPAGMAAVEAAKRRQDDEEAGEQCGTGVSSSASSTVAVAGTNNGNRKRRRRTPSVAPADLGEDERLLVQLKEDENLPWKDIAARFQQEKGRSMQVAALQMRYKRLRERFRVWEEQDVYALKQAHEYWEKFKWQIIAAKMLDFGIQEQWPVKHCTRKWQELEGNANPVPQSATMTPSVSHYSSPVERPVQYTFMPLQ